MKKQPVKKVLKKSKAAGGRVGPGRPVGAIGVKTAFARDELFNHFRCSRGFNEVVTELVATGHYKSRADVLHEALQILAARKLPGDFYWVNKIQ